MKSFWAYIKANWKTNLVGAVTLVYSVPQCVAAFHAFMNHQPVDWRGAVIALVGAGLMAAKDGNNHSTVAQVEKATEEKAISDKK